jgi:acyl-CoA synthetase (AMP-forming)/AMP-acid ligase II
VPAHHVSSLRVVVSGGDTVPPDLVEACERVLAPGFSTVYGQTELSPIVTQTSPGDTEQDNRGTAGRPLWNVEVAVLDPGDGAIVPIGGEGEICARGYQQMIGYLDMPEETAATVDANGWLHTGDLGSMDDRGYLSVTGRLKDMIIRGGENI